MLTTTAKKMSLLAFSALCLQALGVVFGDIGTSPLYVLTAMMGVDKAFYTPDHVMGAIGLICWVLIIVVSAFYCGIVLRINQNGDGGITVLYGKTHRSIDQWFARIGIAGVLADGQITPAISVLSAWCGLLAIPSYIAITTWLQGYVVHGGWVQEITSASLLEAQRVDIGKAIAIVLTIVSLCMLAWIQKKGTSKIGNYFGPIMLVWFGMLIWGGLPKITQHYEILLAPFRVDCIWSLMTHDLQWWKSGALFGATVLASLAAFGAGLLAATGGEALYADMGHFGRWPIIVAWTLVIVGLFTNYMGQGVQLMYGVYTDTPFFALYKNDLHTLTFMVGLAVVASLIAAQALFTGCFSLVVQAVRLRLVPRLRIIFTSDESASHVYVPTVNLFLLVGAICFVLIFRDPDAMTYSYGMAVGTTMSITYILIRRIYKEQKRQIWYIDICGTFIIALTLGAYSKLMESQLGLVPLFNMFVFTMAMTIWEKGQQIILGTENMNDIPTFESLVQMTDTKEVVAPVTRVFTCSHAVGISDRIPLSYLHHLHEAGTIPKNRVFVHVEPVNRSYVSAGTAVASVNVYEVGKGLLQSFAIPLHDLPPAPVQKAVLQKWLRKIHSEAPSGIREAWSIEQLREIFGGDTQHVHNEHWIDFNGSQKVVLIRILQGRKDPPFLVPVLRHLGIVLHNAAHGPENGEISAKVVINHPHVLHDYETVWRTKLLIHTFLWIRNKVQTLSEHLGVPASASEFVTLRIDLQGPLGGEPLTACFARWLNKQKQNTL